jgi:transcriptional regulator with XRE-family HTH domain
MAYLFAMLFRDWRTAKGLSAAEAARQLGIEGVNPGATLARIEAGSRQPDADMVERIIAFTAGQVAASDMHAARLAWLRANRPEKFREASFRAQQGVPAGEAA